MNKRQLQLALAALASAVALLVTGCSTPPDDRGDAGKVVEREKDWKSSTKTYDYDLTIRRPDGTEYELDVTSGGYDHCYRGSSYPKCVSR